MLAPNVLALVGAAVLVAPAVSAHSHGHRNHHKKHPHRIEHPHHSHHSHHSLSLTGKVSAKSTKSAKPPSTTLSESAKATTRSSTSAADALVTTSPGSISSTSSKSHDDGQYHWTPSASSTQAAATTTSAAATGSRSKASSVSTGLVSTGSVEYTTVVSGSFETSSLLVWSTATSTSSPSAPASTESGLTSSGSSSYSLASSLSGDSFFDAFEFQNIADPTNGNVNYLSQDDAISKDLAYTDSNGTVVLQVDSWSTLANGTNRDSVRIQSKETFQIGTLLVVDAGKVPYGPSVWPAFWSLGPGEWPAGGEIDIFEAVNDLTVNQATMHTNDGCTLSTPMNGTGKVLNTDCYAYASDNEACGVQSTDDSSAGAGFAAAGGGVYAMRWDEAGIDVWFFSRADISADITAHAADPDSWGEPMGSWAGDSCAMDTYFGPQSIIFDITICGDWAGGATYAAAYPGKTCADAVMDPTNYKNAQFFINFLDIYSEN